MSPKTETVETAPEATLAVMESWSEPLGKRARAEFSMRGLQIKGSYSIEDGMALLRRWVGINNVSKLAIGDLLVQMERRFGEKYAQAMAASGLEYGTIANYISNCARVPYEVRPDALLPMRVLAAVAPLHDYAGGADGQRQLLADAVAQNQNSDQVRAAAWEWRAEREIAILAPYVEDGLPDLAALLEEARAGEWTIDELRSRVYQIRAELENPIDPPVKKSDAVEPDEVIQPGDQAAEDLRDRLVMLADMWQASADSLPDENAAQAFRRCARDLRSLIK